MKQVSAAFLTLSAVLVGCDPDQAPIDPKTSAEQAALHAGDVIRQTGSGLGFLDDEGGVLSTMFNGADDATNGIMGTATPAPMPAPFIRQMQSSPVVKSMSGVQPIGSFLTQEEQFDDTARDVEALLRDRLLVESNIESKTSTEITYLLKPEPTCRPLPSRLAEQPDAQPDPDCAGDLTKLQVRLVTRTDGDGIRITVLVGPNRYELSTFIIHSDLLAWEVDFAKAVRAVEFMNATLRPNDPQKPLPFTKLEGRIRVALQKLAPKKVKGSLSILDAITVEANDTSSGPVSVHTAKSDPLLAITGDGNTREATIAVAVGQTDVKTSWDPMNVGATNLDLHVSLGGWYGQALLAEGKKQIDFTGVGAGHTFVAVRGTHLFDLDLNPADGRKFDLTVKVNADQTPRFEIVPRFDLSLAFNLGAVASELVNDPPPSYLLHETYTVRLDGASPAVIEGVRSNQTAGFNGGLRVVAGSLTIGTDGTPATTVTVPAGKCLTSRMRPEGSHELLGRFDVVSCP